MVVESRFLSLNMGVKLRQQCGSGLLETGGVSDVMPHMLTTDLVHLTEVDPVEVTATTALHHLGDMITIDLQKNNPPADGIVEAEITTGIATQLTDPPSATGITEENLVEAVVAKCQHLAAVTRDAVVADDKKNA